MCFQWPNVRQAFTLMHITLCSLLDPTPPPLPLSQRFFRYVPVRKSGKPLGIIMLLDHTPDEPEDVQLVEAPSTDPDGEEAAPPEPFEWTPGGLGKPIPAPATSK